jgi:outer membrane protein assembly factor BamA
MFRKISLLLLICIAALPALPQSRPDSTELPYKEKRKKGWSVNPLPVLGYDSDLGLQIGALCQVFNYGNGDNFPEYKHMIYGEFSWFTKGTSIYQIAYDSKFLIPGVRFSGIFDYTTERAVDFYGFNGYEANYIPSVTKEGSDDYISRMFYRLERRKIRFVADFQAPIAKTKLRWLAGLNILWIKTSTVDVARLNKGKSEEKQLPDTALLYDQYVKYQFIRPDEKDGGTTIYLKLGLVWDSRDRESSPRKGIWSEIMLLSAPTFLGNSPYAFARLVVTHRQYVTLVKEYLVFAYRLSYQGTIMGTTPFYMMSYMNSSFSFTSKPDGLGGAKTLRGIMRNRIIGDGMAFGNVELRYKFINFRAFKQNMSFTLTGFLDGGMVVQDHKIYTNTLPEDQYSFYFNDASDHLHLSTGLGLRLSINQNFIIACDYGLALNRQDGTSGLYIGLGHIF